MKSPVRRIAGKLAKYSGANFEGQFRQTCAIQGVECVRLPDGCRSLGAYKLVRTISPFDFVLGYKDRAAFIDTKTTSAKTFSASMITSHQIDSLKKLSSAGKAGYVIAINGGVYFVDVKMLVECRRGTSINFELAVLLGSKASFDIRKIFNETN